MLSPLRSLLVIAGLALSAGAFAAQAAEGFRAPLPGKTDSLGDPGYIGPNGALHKKVVAGDFFTFRDLAEMDLLADDIITLTSFSRLPKRAPREDLDSPFPLR